jgi:two-component system response regulator FixJ
VPTLTQVIATQSEVGHKGVAIARNRVCAGLEWREFLARTIGVVDDDAAIRDSLRFLLSVRGFDTKCYASAAEFLRSADADELSGLLIDQHMPDMTGIELVELLRSRRISTPAIMLTGGSDPTLAARAKKAGVVALLHKPVAGSELISWIKSAFSARNSGQSPQ